MVLDISSAADFASQIGKEGVVVVDFGATWCGPCRVISPYFHSLDGEYPDITFVAVDIDKAQELAAEYGINSVPTFLVFKGGKKVDQLIGANKEALKDLLDRHNV